MLAFIHIEKCAGTTFKSILQRNYGAGYCDVRPVYPPSEKDFDLIATEAYKSLVLEGGNPSQFGPHDLQAYRQLAPWIRCISGHSLRPCLGLDRSVSELRYVTVFRNPMSRYVSYFTYGTGTPRRPWGFSFEEYLDKAKFHNFQTKKIACKSDLEAAKEILERQFMMVGVMEEFDEFLCLLKRQIDSVNFDIAYQSLNTRRTKPDECFQQFEERIRHNNSVDLELYDYVRQSILPRQRSEYGPGLQAAVSRFRATNQSSKTGLSLRSFVQQLVQRLYLDTAVGLMRRRSGLPWKTPY